MNTYSILPNTIKLPIHIEIDNLRLWNIILQKALETYSKYAFVGSLLAAFQYLRLRFGDHFRIHPTDTSKTNKKNEGTTPTL